MKNIYVGYGYEGPEFEEFGNKVAKAIMIFAIICLSAAIMLA